MRMPIVIYGAGGLGKEVKSILMNNGSWNFLGFIDDGIQEGTCVQDKPVLGGINYLRSLKEKIYAVLALGSPQVKEKLFNSLVSSEFLEFPFVLDKRAVIMDQDHIEIGSGTILTAGCVLTTDIKVGRHVLINLNVTIGHDCEIGDFTSIMPGCNIAGQVKIGQNVLIGSGAIILGGIEIGDGCLVGAGSVVTKNVKPGIKVIGVPAREFKL